MTFKLANITELRQAKAMGLKNMYYAFWYPLPLLIGALSFKSCIIPTV